MSSVPTILVIEDHLPDVTVLRHALNKQGVAYALETLTDGDAALQYIADHRTGKHAVPCVIVLDLHLPRFHGTEILAAIRQDPVLTDINVMVLTGAIHVTERAQLEANGALCRTKPTALSGWAALAAELFALCGQTQPQAATA